MLFICTTIAEHYDEVASYKLNSSTIDELGEWCLKEEVGTVSLTEPNM